MTDARIRLREEVAEQIKALKEMKVMGEYYGLDLSRPAYTAQEAVQWVYMAYLAAVKEQDGAAMSLGTRERNERISSVYTSNTPSLCVLR